MKYPFISMTAGTEISVRFPKPKDTTSVVLGYKGDIPEECYPESSPERRALEWAKQFAPTFKVNDCGNNYILEILFPNIEAAMKYKNQFMFRVHGKTCE